MLELLNMIWINGDNSAMFLEKKWKLFGQIFPKRKIN